MNKLACLFALVCCLSFAACLVEDIYPHVGGVGYPPYYSPPLKSFFSSLLHKSPSSSVYPWMSHQYGSQIPYEGQYPYFYPYSQESQYPGFGQQSLPSYPYYQYPYYQYPYYQYQHQSPLQSSFSYPPSYSSPLSYPYYPSYPYNVPSSFPSTFPTYPSVNPIQI